MVRTSEGPRSNRPGWGDHTQPATSRSLPLAPLSPRFTPCWGVSVGCCSALSRERQHPLLQAEPRCGQPWPHNRFQPLPHPGELGGALPEGTLGPGICQVGSFCHKPKGGGPCLEGPHPPLLLANKGSSLGIKHLTPEAPLLVSDWGPASLVPSEEPLLLA